MKKNNHITIVFISLFCTRVFANECPPQLSPPSELEKVNQFIEKKTCSLENAKKNFNDQSAETYSLERLSTRCQKSWEVQTPKGLLKVPAGLNVLRGPNQEIIFHLKGEILSGKISQEAFTGKKDCSQKMEKPSEEAFKEEARFHLTIAKEINQNQNTEFNQVILGVEQKLKSLNSKNFLSNTKEWEKKIGRRDLDRVSLANHYQEIIKETLDPIEENNKKNSQNTLIIPLSVDWFNSDPVLKTYFQKAWLSSGYDLRITVGHSGEGVVNYPQKSPEENSSYLQMKELILKTKEFLKSQDQSLDFVKSPEAKWLLSQSDDQLTTSKRMIFFSPDTWTRDSKTNKWAEEIPVNQSIGGIPSDYLLSVMIHEINVNSNKFLASDTHGPEEDTKALRQCISKNGLSSMPQDPETLQRLFGYNSQLSVIYLKAFLE